jgi:hypothetical protein
VAPRPAEPLPRLHAPVSARKTSKLLPPLQCLRHHQQQHGIVVILFVVVFIISIIIKFGDLYSAYPALPSRMCYLGNTAGKLNERSRTATSHSQQQIRTESKFTATAGIRTCELRDASAPL